MQSIFEVFYFSKTSSQIHCDGPERKRLESNLREREGEGKEVTSPPPQASLQLERGTELCVEPEIKVFIEMKHLAGNRAIEMLFPKGKGKLDYK